MKKRLLSLLLVIGMLIGMLSVGMAEEYTFSDDDGTGTWKWAGDYIYDCYEAGIINGYEDGTYLPDNELTRAEAAKIIALTFGLSSAATESTFSDVADTHWALQYIEACVEAGIINGYEDGTFLPSQNVTRAEMAKMIAVASGLVSDAAESNFSDVGTHWALQYIEACADAGIITGYEDGTFLPGNNITRAEAAAIISRTLDLLNADADSDDAGSSDADSGSADADSEGSTGSDADADDTGSSGSMDTDGNRDADSDDSGNADSEDNGNTDDNGDSDGDGDTDNNGDSDGNGDEDDGGDNDDSGDSDGDEDGDSPALSDLEAGEIYFSVDTDNTVTFTVTAENIDDTIILYDEDGAVGTMYDDGENGDETAGDGIYTYQLAVNVSSDTNVTQTYYAAAGDCESETVSLYFFPLPTEETIAVYEEEYEEVTTSLEEIRDLYKDDTGYVPADSVEELFAAVEEYLAELMEDGIIVRYVMDEESAYLKLSSGIAIIFEQQYEDTLGDGTDVVLTFSSYMPSSIGGEGSVSDTIEQLADTFESSAVTYSGSEVTLDLITSIGSNQVIFWYGHGGYSSESGNALVTGETLDVSAVGDTLYRNYYLLDCLMSSTPDGENTSYLLITSKFIDKYCGDLSNDLIIISACHSGQLEEDGSSKIPDSLINKGATAVVGFSDVTNARYGRLIGTYTLELMAEINDDTGDYYTLSEALSAAKEKYGDNDSEYFWSLWYGHDSEPLIFGGTEAENYRLYSMDIIGSGTCGNDLTWVLTSDGMLTISGTGAMANYRKATYVPWDSNSITTVVIEDGVTSIGSYAFSQCTSLTSIEIPDSVTSIGSYAFYDCYNLTSITIPDGVTIIGSYAFDFCAGLTCFTIPNSVTSIGRNAFANCSSLSSIVIPYGITDISEATFSGCSSLTSVSIPNSVTSIGERAFGGCSNLTYISIPDSVTSIGEYAFSGSGLTSVTISNAYVYSHAFDSCSDLTCVILSGEQSYISDYVFHECTSLVDITIPDSVISIGEGAFAGCTSLSDITIPDSVTSIDDYAFSGCTGLTSITIPDGVTSIGRQAFWYCTSLTCITIPDGVTSIGKYAFYSCTSLTSIVIPESMASIGMYAFRGCTSLSDVYYAGSEDDWGTISISYYNTCLTSATIHYNYTG